MLAALLALASSLSWGLSDFLGGLQSRHHHLLAVMLLSQGLALAILIVAVLAGAPTAHDSTATAWAAGVGLLGLLGLVAFYRALAIGTMSIVAPISATGVAIPVLADVAQHRTAVVVADLVERLARPAGIVPALQDHAPVGSRESGHGPSA